MDFRSVIHKQPHRAAPFPLSDAQILKCINEAARCIFVFEKCRIRASGQMADVTVVKNSHFIYLLLDRIEPTPGPPWEVNGFQDFAHIYFPVTGSGATAKKAAKNAARNVGSYSVGVDGTILFADTPCFEFDQKRGDWKRSGFHKDAWPNFVLLEKNRQLISRPLHDWFSGNPATIHLPEDLQDKRFLTQCLKKIASQCRNAPFLGQDVVFELIFIHRGRRMFRFLADKGIKSRYLFPLEVAPARKTRMSFYRTRYNRRATAALPVAAKSEWFCAISLDLDGSKKFGDIFVDDLDHAYIGGGNSPVSALNEAISSAADPITLQADGTLYLGNSGNTKSTAKFREESLSWDFPDSTRGTRQLGDFPRSVFDAIWEKAQLHPKLAALLLLDMATK